MCNKSYIGQFSDKYYVCYRVKFCNAKRSSKKKDGSSSIGKKVFSTVLEVLCEFSSCAWIRAKLREGKIHFIIFSFLFV